MLRALSHSDLKASEGREHAFSLSCQSQSLTVTMVKTFCLLSICYLFPCNCPISQPCTTGEPSSVWSGTPLKSHSILLKCPSHHSAHLPQQVLQPSTPIFHYVSTTGYGKEGRAVGPREMIAQETGGRTLLQGTEKILKVTFAGNSRRISVCVGSFKD